MEKRVSETAPLRLHRSDLIKIEDRPLLGIVTLELDEGEVVEFAVNRTVADDLYRILADFLKRSS